MTKDPQGLAVVTGASTGIGYELAKICLAEGFDLIIAADESKIQSVADELRDNNATVEGVQADLSTTEGVDRLLATIGGRPVTALLANAGRGLGKGFLDQNFSEIHRVIDTNVTGTLYLLYLDFAEIRKTACQGSVKRFCWKDDPPRLPGQRIAPRPD